MPDSVWQIDTMQQPVRTMRTGFAVWKIWRFPS